MKFRYLVIPAMIATMAVRSSYAQRRGAPEEPSWAPKPVQVPKYTPPHKPLTVKTARLQRALNNHFEALILFIPAVLLVTLTNQSSPLTQICAGLYLGARILYIPAYVYGLAPWRSAVWGAGFFATMAMVLATLI